MSQTELKDKEVETVDTKKSKKIKVPVDISKGLSFRQFLAIHKKLWTAVDMKRGTPGHTQLMRIWNSLAILFPEKCADMVIWDKEQTQDPKLMKNDLDLSELLKDLED